MKHQRSFTTAGPAGLRHDLLPMRLFQQAKKHGIWDPRDIDLGRDREDWGRLNPVERDTLIRHTSLFQAGEESVVLDLLPLIQVIARERRLEEEIFLTSFLWEEAKHTEFFRRILDEVFEAHEDLHRYLTPSYRKIFCEELPAAMGALATDASPRAQARASVTYNMIVEGVLAETGYQAYFTALERNDLLPGLRRGIAHVKRDESRHIAYGVFLLSRLVAEHPETWDEVQTRMGELVEPALTIIQEIFAAYDVIPFGLRIEEFTDFAMKQFSRRLARIERARGQSMEQIHETWRQEETA